MSYTFFNNFTTNILTEEPDSLIILSTLVFSRLPLMKVDTVQSVIQEFPSRRFQAKIIDSSFVPHLRETHIVAHIEAGQLMLRYRERTFQLKNGDCVFIPAGEYYSFKVPKDTSAVINFHYIDTIRALQVSNFLLLCAIDNIMSTKQLIQPFCEFIFKNIEEALPVESYNLKLKKMLRSLAETHALQNVTLKHDEISRLIEVKQYIHNHVLEQHLLSATAKQFHMSKWFLSRHFKHLFGVTLFQYIHAERIVMAKNDLSLGLSATDVAYKLGYSDQSHFTRFFKRYVGLSPKNWAKWVCSSNSDQSSR